MQPQLVALVGDGCRYLDGKRLRAWKPPTSADKFFRERDITYIAKIWPLRHSETITDANGVVWVAGRVAENVIGCSETCLSNWTHQRCPYLPSEKKEQIRLGLLLLRQRVVVGFKDAKDALVLSAALTYLRDRLTVIRDLLSDSGSIFVQIGDENVHRVRALMDEVFGESNFCSQVTLKTTGGLGSSELKSVTDFIIWYAKMKGQQKFKKPLLVKRQGEGATTGERYDTAYETMIGVYRPLPRPKGMIRLAFRKPFGRFNMEI